MDTRRVPRQMLRCPPPAAVYKLRQAFDVHYGFEGVVGLRYGFSCSSRQRSSVGELHSQTGDAEIVTCKPRHAMQTDNQASQHTHDNRQF